MRPIFLASFIFTFVLASTAHAQVAQLGRAPAQGRVRQVGLLSKMVHPATTFCDDGCGEPGCGVVAPTCGLAGTILGSGPGCGLPEPRCGATGLGYAGGFGLCGACDTCGVGGYIGRNLHRVNPCACGGSLIADLARGMLMLVDRAVGTVANHVFGSLRAVTCHASGTFAALQCAAQAHCYACGGLGCADCGMAAYEDGAVYDYASPTMAEPVQPMPVPDADIDPFQDDPRPQARQPRPLPPHYGARRIAPQNRHAAHRTTSTIRTAAAHTSTSLRGRYLQTQTQNRQTTFRR